MVHIQIPCAIELFIPPLFLLLLVLFPGILAGLREIEHVGLVIELQLLELAPDGEAFGCLGYLPVHVLLKRAGIVLIRARLRIYIAQIVLNTKF